MRYKTVSVLTTKNADERAETMRILDNTGCSYLVRDVLNGKTEITIIEKAAPEKQIGRASCRERVSSPV